MKGLQRYSSDDEYGTVCNDRSYAKSSEYVCSLHTFRTSLLNDDVNRGANPGAISLIGRHCAHLERFDPRRRRRTLFCFPSVYLFLQ